MRLYAITDLLGLAASSGAAEDALIALVPKWAAAGVEVIQIREKHLSTGALEELARRIIAEARAASGPGSSPQIIINGRADVAIAVGADGVHLPGSGAPTLAEVRQLFAECGRAAPTISVACHSIVEIEKARDEGATMALFSPVFGKVTRTREGSAESPSIPGVGLAALGAACEAAGEMPVFALGGVTAQNAAACIAAGAVGVAAIRFFQI